MVISRRWVTRKIHLDKNNTQGAEFHKETIIEIEENGKQEETFHEGYVDETIGKDNNNVKGAPFHKEAIIEIEENGKQEETFHKGYVDEIIGKGSLDPRFSQAALSVSETHMTSESAKKWGVVKGIVYGGLAESSTVPEVITSDNPSGIVQPGDSQNAQDIHGSETSIITGTEHPKKWGILKGVVNVGLTKSITSPAAIVSSPVEVIGSDQSIASPTIQVTAVSATLAPTIPGSENSNNWDILKSIVYGGLIESITSLGIVTSAAGADATTLHILALALANLIGGLFVIGHNVVDLRNDQSGESTSETSRQTDRYYRQLGERENFKLHVTVVVLSFLLFGLVPPVTYGFSFLKSDNKDLKLVAVAAASLLCITLLAIGKAYIQKASNFFGYIKTILYYVVVGFIASGLSYVIGELIKKLLEKLGLFKSSSTSTLFLPGTALSKPGWESF